MHDHLTEDIKTEAQRVEERAEVVRQGRTGAILRLLATQEMWTIADFAKRARSIIPGKGARLSKADAKGALDSCARAGFLTREKDGPWFRYYRTAAGKQAGEVLAVAQAARTAEAEREQLKGD